MSILGFAFVDTPRSQQCCWMTLLKARRLGNLVPKFGFTIKERVHESMSNLVSKLLPRIEIGKGDKDHATELFLAASSTCVTCQETSRGKRFATKTQMQGRDDLHPSSDGLQPNSDGLEGNTKE